MADQPLPNAFKLPAEVKNRLTTLKDDVARAQHGIAVMKKLGMDTTELEEKLKWAEEVRTTLLKEFS